ncbi:MAG: hypothetical protein OXI73_08615, partial [Rhodospirillales bacterium]|nr:hypothetical protein [Rhodospirillales bacterium]
VYSEQSSINSAAMFESASALPKHPEILKHPAQRGDADCIKRHEKIARLSRPTPNVRRTTT